MANKFLTSSSLIFLILLAILKGSNISCDTLFERKDARLSKIPEDQRDNIINQQFRDVETSSNYVDEIRQKSCEICEQKLENVIKFLTKNGDLLFHYTFDENNNVNEISKDSLSSVELGTYLISDTTRETSNKEENDDNQNLKNLDVEEDYFSSFEYNESFDSNRYTFDDSDTTESESWYNFKEEANSNQDDSGITNEWLPLNQNSKVSKNYFNDSDENVNTEENENLNNSEINLLFDQQTISNNIIAKKNQYYDINTNNNEVLYADELNLEIESDISNSADLNKSEVNDITFESAFSNFNENFNYYNEEDSDQDGIPDSQDDDLNNEGIPDFIDNNEENSVQNDIPHSLDYGLDNSGIPDFLDNKEKELNPDGIQIPLVDDSDNNEIHDFFVNNEEDSDQDGIPDSLDDDLDNDGIPDILDNNGDDVDALGYFEEDYNIQSEIQNFGDNVDLDDILDKVKKDEPVSLTGLLLKDELVIGDGVELNKFKKVEESERNEETDSRDQQVDKAMNKETNSRDQQIDKVLNEETSSSNFQEENKMFGLDNDNDGIPDFNDEDDDNDGIPDYLDDDFDDDKFSDFLDNEKDSLQFNDVILDNTNGAVIKSELGSSLPEFSAIDNSEFLDSDSDGIPDYLDEDDDNDGIPDYLDDDDNGEGVLDFLDDTFLPTNKEILSLNTIENNEISSNDELNADLLFESEDAVSENKETITGTSNEDINSVEILSADFQHEFEEKNTNEKPYLINDLEDSININNNDLNNIIDSDFDGIPDILDDDDDNDGIPDYLDEDDDGDGILDFLEVEYSQALGEEPINSFTEVRKNLSEFELNKINYGYEKIENIIEKQEHLLDSTDDRKSSSDDYSTEIENSDLNKVLVNHEQILEYNNFETIGDSLDELEKDSDFDGIPNDIDTDDDNDGIPDWLDEDDDGDGTLNFLEENYQPGSINNNLETLENDNLLINSEYEKELDVDKKKNNEEENINNFQGDNTFVNEIDDGFNKLDFTDDDNEGIQNYLDKDDNEDGILDIFEEQSHIDDYIESSSEISNNELIHENSEEKTIALNQENSDIKNPLDILQSDEQIDHKEDSNAKSKNLEIIEKLKENDAEEVIDDMHIFMNYNASTETELITPSSFNPEIDEQTKNEDTLNLTDSDNDGIPDYLDDHDDNDELSDFFEKEFIVDENLDRFNEEKFENNFVENQLSKSENEQTEVSEINEVIDENKINIDPEIGMFEKMLAEEGEFLDSVDPTPDAFNLYNTFTDSDSDGIPDYLDEDDDNDGIPDYLDDNNDMVTYSSKNGNFYENAATEQKSGLETEKRFDNKIGETENFDEVNVENAEKNTDIPKSFKVTDSIKKMIFSYFSKLRKLTNGDSYSDAKNKSVERGGQSENQNLISLSELTNQDQNSQRLSNVADPQEQNSQQLLDLVDHQEHKKIFSREILFADDPRNNPPVGISIDITTDTDGDGIPDFRDEDDDDDSIPDEYDSETKLPWFLNVPRVKEIINDTEDEVERNELLDELIQLMDSSTAEQFDISVFRDLDAERKKHIVDILKSLEKHVLVNTPSSLHDHQEEENIDLWTVLKLIVFGKS